MTVKEAIDKTDSLFPNAFTYQQKASWIRELDLKVYYGFLSEYEGKSGEPSDTYCTDISTPLLIEEPFADIYTRYLAMQFDISGGDIAGYSNSAALFNSTYLAFMNYYNRNHRAKAFCIYMN